MHSVRVPLHPSCRRSLETPQGASSPVLAAVTSLDVGAIAPDAKALVVIRDCDPDLFGIILRFIYTGSCECVRS